MTEAQVKETVELFDDGDLDDLVHDAKSQEASSINNEGVEAQVRFLLETGYTLETLRAALKEQDPRSCPACGWLGDPQTYRNGMTTYACCNMQCDYEDQWEVEEVDKSDTTAAIPFSIDEA